MIITRIAPSPTGQVHIGTVRTAYFNWLFARANNGKFLLRIDDTDSDRNNEDHVTSILNALGWLGLDYDLSFRQSDRINIYQGFANDLLDNDIAYRAENGAVLLKQINLPELWTDQITGDIKITPREIETIHDLVLIRSDGVATYHFANVIDDHAFGVNTVIRGTDHISNTSKQIAIYKAFGWELPKYYHIGLIHKDGEKLSKRNNASSVLFYKDSGYDPDAILNFLLRMGWGPKVDDKSTAVLPKDKAVSLFLDGKMRAAKSNFDQDKLDSFDRKYKARKQH